MKPYSFDAEGYHDIGCCPGHDFPRTYRWGGKYSSPSSMRAASKANKEAKRLRRHKDKQRLKKDIDDQL